MSTLAVLPVKTFGRAKSRTGLDPERREALVEAMVVDVLNALVEVDGLAGVVVVTREPRAAGPARALGLHVVDDAHQRGHNPAARLGVRAAVQLGASRVLLVPGDCPGLDATEVDALLAGAQPGATIVADRHGSGTNALLLDPPDALDPSFGPGSFARHAALACGAGATPHVADVPSLAFDVDTPQDLTALRRAGPRTRALLGVIHA